MKPIEFWWLLVLSLLPNAGGAEEPSKTKLVIVTPKVWQAELRDYLEQRAERVQGQVVAWEELVEQHPGADEPEKIKRYLYELWRQKSLDHLLVVGDAATTPVRYMVLDRVTPAAFDYAFYPSDLYYADLAKSDGSFESWNGAANDFHAQYFGEVRGEKNKIDPINFDAIDYRAEIGVGRWPIRTVEQLRVVIAKSLDYERRVSNGRHPAAKRAAFFSVGGWIDSRSNLDLIAQDLKDWRIEKRYFTDAHRNDKTEKPDAAQVERVLLDGAALIFHAGHGEVNGWHQCVTWPQISGVSNRDRLPIILSAGCDTAVFAPLGPYQAYVDNRGVEHPGTNSGESFTAPPPAPAPIQPEKFTVSSIGTQLVVGGPDGAVAYFGCTTGAQPCALGLLQGFGRSTGSAESTPMLLGTAYCGMIEYYAKAEKLSELKPTADWYPPSIFFQGMKFVLFGDPSLPIAR